MDVHADFNIETKLGSLMIVSSSNFIKLRENISDELLSIQTSFTISWLCGRADRLGQRAVKRLVHMATFKVGDQVKWSSHGAQAHGKIVRVAHESGEVSGFHYQASSEDPRYIVEVDSGKLTAHTGEALSKA